MPSYHIKHVTKYTYTAPVTDSANQIILKLESDPHQEVVHQKITLRPDAEIDNYTNYFGSQVGMFTIVEPHNELSIVSIAEVETTEIPEPIITMPPHKQWQHIAALKEDISFLDFIKPELFDVKSEILKEMDLCHEASSSVLEFVQHLSQYVYENFSYQQGITNVETGIDEIWHLKAGVCQDFAHLLLEMLRLKGIPARYVSGYICPKGNELRGEGATHAWVEAYIPSYGWVGIDPTNDCLVSDRHIRIAFGRNFNDCTPVKGTFKGQGAHTLSVSVIITNEKEEADDLLLNKTPVYISVAEPEIMNKGNSYQRFMEMQQQQ
jgi:transglutaminase-like putative cysteine protease